MAGKLSKDLKKHTLEYAKFMNRHISNVKQYTKKDDLERLYSTFEDIKKYNEISDLLREDIYEELQIFYYGE